MPVKERRRSSTTVAVISRRLQRASGRYRKGPREPLRIPKYARSLLNRRTYNQIVSQVDADNSCDLVPEGELEVGTRAFYLRERIVASEAWYKDTWETWKQHETKSQILITIASLLAAGANSLFTGAIVSKLVPSVVELLMAAYVAIAVTIVFAVLALRVRSVRTIPAAEDTHRFANDILEAGTFDSQTYLGYLVNTNNAWLEITRSVSKASADKAKWVFVAQCALSIAVMALSLAVCVLGTGSLLKMLG